MRGRKKARLSHRASQGNGRSVKEKVHKTKRAGRLNFASRKELVKVGSTKEETGDKRRSKGNFLYLLGCTSKMGRVVGDKGVEFSSAEG